MKYCHKLDFGGCLPVNSIERLTDSQEVMPPEKALARAGAFFNEIRLSANTSLNLSLSLELTTLLPLSPPDKFSHRILREVNFYVNILQKL